MTEFTGGVTPGFSANSQPIGITTGSDGNIWFTEIESPGALGRVNPNGSVTEFTGGVTPGFSANRALRGITTGPDGNIWFTEQTNPGALGRVNPNGSVTEFTGGVISGFSANRVPTGITTGPDGNIWFTEQTNPGALGRITLSPYAVTGAASGVGASSAILAGTVCPNNEATSYRFDYGTTTAYGSQTVSTNAISGTAPAAASAAVSGLAPSTLYHYRLRATSATDTSVGTDRTFRTAPAGGGPGAGGGAATPLALLSRLRISPASLPSARRGPSALAAQPRRASAIVSFRLDRAASVRFTVERALPGRVAALSKLTWAGPRQAPRRSSP